MSPQPDVGEVEREAARDDEDGVDANIVARACKARGKRFRCGGNTAQAMAIERHGGGIGGGALLDLDERDQFAAPGDEIDLAPAHFHPPRQNPPSVKPQPPRGDGFGAATALLGLPPVQSGDPSARARA